MHSAVAWSRERDPSPSPVKRVPESAPSTWMVDCLERQFEVPRDSRASPADPSLGKAATLPQTSVRMAHGVEWRGLIHDPARARLNERMS